MVEFFFHPLSASHGVAWGNWGSRTGQQRGRGLLCHPGEIVSHCIFDVKRRFRRWPPFTRRLSSKASELWVIESVTGRLPLQLPDHNTTGTPTRAKERISDKRVEERLPIALTQQLAYSQDMEVLTLISLLRIGPL
jgi:hypothetical protein